jgi:FkbM family methyltransferase
LPSDGWPVASADYEEAVYFAACDRSMPTRELKDLLRRVGRTPLEFARDVERLHADPDLLAARDRCCHVPPSEPADGPMRLHFDHGLGDCCQFAALLQLWLRRGFTIEISGDPNKDWLWNAAGLTVVPWLPRNVPVGWGYPWQFSHLDEPEHLANKTAHNLLAQELPHLGSRETLWRELITLRLDLRSAISDAARLEVAGFLAGLPRPIVAIHSKGTNWQDRKSLPDGLAFQLYDRLLSHGCSVVILDWDDRAPRRDHVRVRTLNQWGKIDLDRTAALLLACDLLIGIDSGPFHFTNVLPGVRALGVFRASLPASHVCLPNPDATYLVPDEHRAQMAPYWQTIGYTGTYPTPDAAASEGLRLLQQETLTVTIPSNIAGHYIYRRVGYDERPLELLPDGTIGEGAGGCEEYWTLTGQVLAVHGKGRVTCRLEKDDDDVWRGRWIHDERMPIELVPKQACPESPEEGLARQQGFWVRHGQHGAQDLAVIAEVYLQDCYRTALRGKLGNGLVVDVGAHIGTFARLWHERDPKATIVCIEACPENVSALAANVSGFATVIQAACTYEDGPLLLHNSVMPDGTATGGSIVSGSRDYSEHLYWLDKRPMLRVTLEHVMAMTGHDCIDVLKLDCEGSEFSILGKSPSLNRIGFIFGEYHGWEWFQRLRAERFQGWDFGHMSGGDLGIFHLAHPAACRI